MLVVRQLVLAARKPAGEQMLQQMARDGVWAGP
jgi:hypothetical protein